MLLSRANYDLSAYIFILVPVGIEPTTLAFASAMLYQMSQTVQCPFKSIVVVTVKVSSFLLTSGTIIWSHYQPVELVNKKDTLVEFTYVITVCEAHGVIFAKLFQKCMKDVPLKAIVTVKKKEKKKTVGHRPVFCAEIFTPFSFCHWSIFCSSQGHDQ